MRPKYTERLKQGLTIGATVLAFNGCDARKNISQAIDIRLEVNSCLRQAHPDRGLNTELIWGDVSEPPLHWIFIHGLDTKAIGCGLNQIIINTKDCATLMHQRGEMLCTDKNVDGKWERVQSLPSGSDVLTSADEKKDPTNWRKYQNACNAAFSQCLDQ